MVVGDGRRVEANRGERKQEKGLISVRVQHLESLLKRVKLLSVVSLTQVDAASTPQQILRALLWVKTPLFLSGCSPGYSSFHRFGFVMGLSAFISLHSISLMSPITTPLFPRRYLFNFTSTVFLPLTQTPAALVDDGVSAGRLRAG